MKKFKKLLSSVLGISLSMSIFATNLHATNSFIHDCMNNYFRSKNFICNYMSVRNINFLNFFVLVYNLHILPSEDHRLITSLSKEIFESLGMIEDAFYNTNKENQASIVENILKEYCQYKRYNYNQILNIINSNQIIDCEFLPLQNASIEPEISEQHGMELSITFHRNLTSSEKDIFYSYGIACEDNIIYFGI